MNLIRMPLFVLAGQNRHHEQRLGNPRSRRRQRRLAASRRPGLGQPLRRGLESNDDALETGCRLLSAYQDRHGVKFWIITEWDRSVTTVLLPEDY